MVVGDDFRGAEIFGTCGCKALAERRWVGVADEVADGTLMSQVWRLRASYPTDPASKGVEGDRIKGGWMTREHLKLVGPGAMLAESAREI